MTPRKSSSAYRTKRLALSALFCALGVVMMGMGALLELIDLTTTALASLILLPIMLCYGKRYALIAYAVTGILSLILMPQSMAPWLYLSLLGYYPMLRPLIQRLPKAIAAAVKALLILLVLGLYMVAIYFLTMQGSGSLSQVFAAAFGEPGEGAWMGWAVIILSFIAFFAYDLLIDRLLILYRYKWQTRIERWMK